MKFQILVVRLLSATVLFSGGVLTGWWLHDDLHHAAYSKPAAISSTIDEFQQPLPLIYEVPPAFEAQFPEESQEFLACLNESRFDDALTLYQRHENAGSEVYPRLRHLLLTTLKNWSEQGKLEPCISALDRFTQYYYQDIELFKVLVATLESNKNIAQAIETSLSARPFADKSADLEYFNNSIHRLAKILYSNNSKSDRLEASLPLFQKLAHLEPEHGFYRFALAESYLAIGDIESAIRELETLQLDQEFGRKASRLLAELFPPLPDEPDEIPAGQIPLGVSGQHYIAAIRAGDKVDANLLIDTGASLTTLPSRVLNELKRKRQAHRVGHVDLKTANGLRFSPLYRLKNFQIGEFTLQNLEVAELDMAVGGSADGLLGMNVLSQFMFQIDQDKQVLTLIPR